MAKKKALTIDEEEYPSNSEASRSAPIREERKKEIIEESDNQEVEENIKTLPRGRVMRRKKTFVQSIAETLVGNGSNNIGGYILHEVLLPTLKTMIKESVTSGIEMLLGEVSGSSRRPEKERSTISYGSYYKRRDDDRKRPSGRGRDRFDLDDIYFKDHGDAEEILDRLCERLEEYEAVSVAEYLEMCNVDGDAPRWTLDKWGWTNLKRAYLTHTRHGYAIVLPEPKELDD